MGHDSVARQHQISVVDIRCRFASPYSLSQTIKKIGCIPHLIRKKNTCNKKIDYNLSPVHRLDLYRTVSLQSSQSPITVLLAFYQ